MNSLEIGRIRYINKKPSAQYALRGELVGISWLSANFLGAMCDYHAANKPHTLQYHYEENDKAILHFFSLLIFINDGFS